MRNSFPSEQLKGTCLPGQNNRGQILVEYVLLMVVAISVAFLITSVMVSRNSDQPGFLISKWYDIIREIGNDPADDLAPQDGGS